MTAPQAASRRGVLFVAGERPNSRLARTNVGRLLEEVGGCELRVVDVLEDYEAAIEHGILVTPSLVQTHPGPPVTIVGSLADLERVRAALRLEGAAE